VVLVDIDESKLVAKCEEIKQETGGEVVPVVADVAKDEDNRRIVEVAFETFGGVHVSFINAGVLTQHLLADVTDNDIDATFGANFKGVVFGLKHQLPAISKTWDNGAVVVTTSLAGTKVETENPRLSVYGASKAAAEMMIKYGAVEGAAMNVRVNGIAPGLVRTPLVLPMGEQMLQEAWKRTHLTGKEILPEHVVPLVMFLLSDGAKAMTGSIHRIDQGASLT
ncbi:unnamed protein product, partial [Ascophyllum nodosum]